jgi:5'(3')-deoxyribonucleotidase
MMYHTLYCDMDGVLADFESYVNEQLGLKIDLNDGPEKEKAWKDAIVERLKHNWWLDIPKFPDATSLWRGIKSLSPKVLSAYAPWDEKRSRSAKPTWMKRHFQVPERDIVLCLRKEKQLYAIDKKTKLPNVLIDDYDKNIREWEAAGGHGILHKSANSTLRALKDLGIL